MTHKPRPLIDLLISIVLPSVILMRLSGDEHLGAVGALVLALAFPIGLGLYELIATRHRMAGNQGGGDSCDIGNRGDWLGANWQTIYQGAAV
jgi:hypothetical protein